MEYYLIILCTISFISNGVYSIVPKYISNSEIYFKSRSLADARFPKHRHSQHSNIPKADSTFVQSRQYPINMPDDRRSNRLPEVNIKEAIDDSTVMDSNPVDDFEDFFEEDNEGDEIMKTSESGFSTKVNFFSNSNAKEAESIEEFRKVPKNVNINYNYKRVKRLAGSAYDGRYKAQDLNTVLNAIAESGIKQQTKKNANYKLKSRLRRTSNIIEEENLGTTISGFKFTGRTSHLNHDLAFKNIHSK